MSNMTTQTDTAGVCICHESPEAWRRCPLPQHDHEQWTEHGWNCPQSCEHPDAIAAHDEHAPWSYTEFGVLCSCGEAMRNDDICYGIEPWRVGDQVEFSENAEHPRVLGVVSRVWPNGRYLTIVTDGRTFVREHVRVGRCGR